MVRNSLKSYLVAESLLLSLRHQKVTINNLNQLCNLAQKWGVTLPCARPLEQVLIYLLLSVRRSGCVSVNAA